MKNKLVTVIAAVLAAGIACWGGYVFCTQVTLGGTRELFALIPVYIILMFFGALVVEIVHEGAHFLVGACCSMGVKLPKFHIFKSSSVDVFPKGARCMRLRFVLTAGAGLFFNLILIIVGVIAFAVPSVPPFLGVALPYAFYSFVINGAPLEYGSGKTDGLVIAEALSHSDSSQVMFAILRVQGLVNAGVMLKDVDESMLTDVPQLPEDDINFIVLTQLRYEYYLAKGDDVTAKKYLSRFNELIQYLPDGYADNNQ